MDGITREHGRAYKTIKRGALFYNRGDVVGIIETDIGKKKRKLIKGIAGRLTVALKLPTRREKARVRFAIY